VGMSACPTGVDLSSTAEPMVIATMSCILICLFGMVSKELLCCRLEEMFGMRKGQSVGRALYRRWKRGLGEQQCRTMHSRQLKQRC